MDIAAECSRELVVFMVLWRQVFEEVEDQAVLVVQCGFRGDDALVEVAELLWCFWGVSFAP